MKTIGLIGGTTWLSTVDYYRLINEGVSRQLGGVHSAKILLYSMDFAEKKKLLDNNDWNTIASCYCEFALKLETAGADCLVLCANTPHTIADEIIKAIHIPLIHIAEATADEIAKQQVKKVGLLGTRFTMEQSFYKDKLAAKGIAVFTPGETDRMFINNSIFNEMAKGIFSPRNKRAVPVHHQ